MSRGVLYCNQLSRIQPYGRIYRNDGGLPRNLFRRARLLHAAVEKGGPVQNNSKGCHIIAYEVYKYLAERNLPLSEGDSLEEERMWGMEVCPEYFGEFPVPTETPWGVPAQHERLWNGLYWLKTEQAGWGLAIAYPLWDGLSDLAIDLGELTDYDRQHGIDNTFGYRFYRYTASCIPIYKKVRY